MLIRTILILSFLHWFLNGQSQNIDTLISGVEYSMVRDLTSKNVTYIFTVRNRSKETLSISQFGINNNKILVHNSKKEKVGYDFIVCGDFKGNFIEPDSSLTWKSEIIQFIPSPYQTFVRREKVMVLDSLYILEWRIKNHILGPVNYYIEKDLIVNLYHSQSEVRKQSEKLLRDLFELGLLDTKYESYNKSR